MQPQSRRTYTTILWIGDSVWKHPERFPLFVQRLKELGINTGIVLGDADPQPFVDSGFPYYVENVVNRGLCLKFSSTVTDWDRFVTQWAKSGRSETAFVRDYCLTDPMWLQWARQRMQLAVRRHKDNAPLFYDIRDELSTTLSANPFDYDYSPQSLAGFRTWLRTQYLTLEILNRSWLTVFPDWDAVMPFSTDQIKNRMAGGGAIPQGTPDWNALAQTTFEQSTAGKDPTRWNFAPWCDFRTYMDSTLAHALREIRSAAQAVDPKARCGIEGTQMASAFGGYDLWRLSQVVDWVEPYDIAGAREIWGSFLPGKPMLTTVGEQDARSAQRRLWHLSLLGDSGCIVWWSEDCIDFGKDNWPLTPRAQALAPVLKELQCPLAERFRQADRETDPIYLHYSQPSIQIAWLLESTGDGATWQRRFSSFEASNNHHAQVRMAWLLVLQDLGYTPQFSATLENLPSNATVILPHSYALTDTERRALGRFRTVLSSGPIGAFDGHGRLREEGGRIRVPNVYPGNIEEYVISRLKPGQGAPLTQWLTRHLPVPPPVRLPPEDCVRVHRYRSGTERLLAFERGIAYQMSESLQQAGGNQVLEKPIAVTIALDRPARITDLRTGTSAGRTATLRFTLDPWQPSLFSLH